MCAQGVLLMAAVLNGSFVIGYCCCVDWTSPVQSIPPANFAVRHSISAGKTPAATDAGGNGAVEISDDGWVEERSGHTKSASQPTAVKSYSAAPRTCVFLLLRC